MMGTASKLATLMGALLISANAGAGAEQPSVEPTPSLTPPKPEVDFGYDGGFFLRAPEGTTLVVNGFAQPRYTYSRAEGSELHNFDLALGRLAFSGDLWGEDVSYFLQFEGSTFGNTNLIQMLDWNMTYSVSPELNIQAGRLILPFSRQFYTHPGELLFSDLSAADYAFNLPRSLGVHVFGSKGPVHYHALAVNSVRALGDVSQVNVGNDIGAAGRIEVDVLEAYGYRESAPAQESGPQLSIGAAFGYNPVVTGSAFQNTAPGDRAFNGTLDLGARFGDVTLQAAYYHRRNQRSERRGAPESTGTDTGYYAQAGVFLVPDHLELAARVSGVDFDERENVNDVNRNYAAGDILELTGGLNLYRSGHGVKLQLDYSYIELTPFGPDSTVSEQHRVRIQSQILF
ncbi:MAG: hypothetical protein AAFQ82_07125 [Myxococcota bacterium]